MLTQFCGQCPGNAFVPVVVWLIFSVRQPLNQLTRSGQSSSPTCVSQPSKVFKESGRGESLPVSGHFA